MVAEAYHHLKTLMLKRGTNFNEFEVWHVKTEPLLPTRGMWKCEAGDRGKGKSLLSA
jgi:hypothetical protein